MPAHSTFDVVVVGGGPAGSTVAARLAQLGHTVALIDRGRARRGHHSETLAPGTLDLLELTGAADAIRTAGFRAVESMAVEWDAGRLARPMPAGSLLVDRERFDAVLRDHAGECGATVIHPVAARARRRVASGWEIALDTHDRSVRATFLVDAGGRPADLRRTVRDPLLAVTGCWATSIDQPTVVALDDCWVWAAPASTDEAGATCEVTVLLDPLTWRSRPGDHLNRYAALVEAADVVAPGTSMIGAVTTNDATSALADEVCGSDWLAVGDAALALDPLSSTGVQGAVRAGLTAAVAIHTALTTPADTTLALDHYRRTLQRAAEHHTQWTAESYGSVAATRCTPFWLARAALPPTRSGPDESRPSLPLPSPGTRVRRASTVKFVETSQVIDDRVRLAAAVEHPALDGPVAFVGGDPVVPLLRDLDGVSTLGDLVEQWTATLPPRRAVALAGWMIERGVLEEVAG